MCSRMPVKVCVQRCSFIIMSSPAPLKQKVSQKFWESENADALVLPDPSAGNLRALGIEGPSPKPTPLAMISAHWASVENVFVGVFRRKMLPNPKPPWGLLQCEEHWECRTICVNSCFIVAVCLLFQSTVCKNQTSYGLTICCYIVVIVLFWGQLNYFAWSFSLAYLY